MIHDNSTLNIFIQNHESLIAVSETGIRDLAGIITRDFRGIKNVNFATLLLSSEAEADREQPRALTFEKPISIGLSNHLQRPFTSPSWMDKKVHQVNVKMSQEMKVFLRLLIITSLKRHTIFIVATLLKYRECREFHFAFY